MNSPGDSVGAEQLALENQALELLLDALVPGGLGRAVAV